MIDQAAALRNMVRHQDGNTREHPIPALPMVLMVGGKGGVGTTTLAVNLSMALAKCGKRPVLVDADLYRADAALLCGVTERRTLADVQGGRCGIEQAVQNAPGGGLIVPGLWAPGRPVSMTEASWSRLYAQLNSLASRADVMLLDTGGGAGEIRRKLWRDATDIVVVTRTDDLSVMDAYATIKVMRNIESGRDGRRLHLVVNAVEHTEEGKQVFDRILNSCQRFLGIEIHYLGAVRKNAELQSAGISKLDINVDVAYIDLAKNLIAVMAGGESGESVAE